MNPFKSKIPGLEKKYNPEGIWFSTPMKNPPKFPLNSNPPEVLTTLLTEGDKWSALDELWSEGLLESKGNGKWVVLFSIYDSIDSDEDPEILNSLEIPKPQNLPIEATSFSHVGDKQFRINIEAAHPQFGPLREGDPPRYGRVFYISGQDIVPLTKGQAELFNAACDRGLEEDSIESRMEYLAKTKQAAFQADARMDGYLKSENYDFKNDAGLDLIEDGPEEIRVIPAVEGLKEFGVSGETLLGETKHSVFTKARANNRRDRLVVGKELQDKISELPEMGRFAGADIPRLIVNPEQVLPEGFDLELFSKRVRGIKTRVYNSRPYIHVSKKSGGWFEGVPGVELEDWSPIGVQSEKGASEESLSGKPEGLSEETYRKLLKKAKESGEEYVYHEGNWIRIDPSQGDQFEAALNASEPTADGGIRIPEGAILDIYENLEVLEYEDDSTLAEEDQLLPDDLPEISIPSAFNGNLFPYQFNGYRWLNRLSSNLIGGLLADEMGLGKTIQVISHFLKLKESGITDPHLVVMPKSLLENWMQEMKNFSNGELLFYAYDGYRRRFSKTLFDQVDVVLTTYDTLRRDQAKIATIDWNMVVCDEAQYAKNPTTQRTCAVKALKAKHRAALTGTPVENGLIEFWCIMDFVQPGLLGSWADFRTNYERPIVSSDGEERDNLVNSLLGEIKGHYLRRLKEEHLQLPEKKYHYRKTGLSDQQLEYYKIIANIGRTGGKGAALGAIQRLIMLCAHPDTFIGENTSTSLEQSNFSCPKLDATLDIISEVSTSAEKVIIFTDFKIVQRVLQKAIREKFGIWPDIINGEITNNRQQIIDIFSEKDGFNAIILGHQVAGVGLNITAANHVIHYTRPWNPAKENQATDRTHRIGQTKPVHIYYPIVKNPDFTTVEERLDELIQSKAGLAKDVLRPTAESKVKTEELLNCLDISK